MRIVQLVTRPCCSTRRASPALRFSTCSLLVLGQSSLRASASAPGRVRRTGCRDS
ncbi:MAG: hypothetical protein MZW92_43925 [Comamonadaceae bacterium]|nr:hypothetical protein [Comamonadaceae bacterium]